MICIHNDITKHSAVKPDWIDLKRLHKNIRLICRCFAMQASCKMSKVCNLSLEWHHNNSKSFYPPYCHCCTWPLGTADGTCAHTCQVCPPALAWCLCAAGRLHSLMTWPASPCRWYSPGIANQNTLAAIHHDSVFIILSHLVLTSNCDRVHLLVRTKLLSPVCVSFSHLIWHHFNLLCVSSHHILWVFPLS